MDLASLRPTFDAVEAGSSIDAWAWLPRLNIAGPVPAARCSHAACAIDDVSFLVVGGGACEEVPRGAGAAPDTAWVHFADVWQFSALDVSWRRLDRQLGDDDGLPGGSDRGTMLHMPARRGHAAAFCPQRRLLVIFGGTSGGVGAEGLLGDVWAFHVDSGVWTQPCAGPGSSGVEWPAERRGCSGWLDNGRFYVLGGYTAGATQWDSTLWALDRDTWTWAK